MTSLRDQILEAAARTYRDRGREATTLRAIADRAGVSTPSVHLPVRLHVPTRLDARLAAREGRQVHMQATVTQDDVVVVTAGAMFIEVDMQHLAAPAERFGLT